MQDFLKGNNFHKNDCTCRNKYLSTLFCCFFVWKISTQSKTCEWHLRHLPLFHVCLKKLFFFICDQCDDTYYKRAQWNWKPEYSPQSCFPVWPVYFERSPSQRTEAMQKNKTYNFSVGWKQHWVWFLQLPSRWNKSEASKYCVSALGINKRCVFFCNEKISTKDCQRCQKLNPNLEKRHWK